MRSARELWRRSAEETTASELGAAGSRRGRAEGTNASAEIEADRRAVDATSGRRGAAEKDVAFDHAAAACELGGVERTSRSDGIAAGIVDGVRQLDSCWHRANNAQCCQHASSVRCCQLANSVRCCQLVNSVRSVRCWQHASSVRRWQHASSVHEQGTNDQWRVRSTGW